MDCNIVEHGRLERLDVVQVGHMHQLSIVGPEAKSFCFFF
jgi:hypothetical protein